MEWDVTREEKVRQLIAESFNGNQANFARAISKSAAQVNQWLNGYRSIGDAVALQIEKALNLPIGWLDGETHNQKQSESNIEYLGQPKFWSSKDPLPDEEYVYAPFYKDVKFSGGTGSFDQEDKNGFKLPFGRATLHNKGIYPKDVICFGSKDNSMYPVIPDGNTIGVNTANKTIKDGKIYAFEHGDMFRFKVLYKLPNNQVRIHSYNDSEYPDETVNSSEINIIGHVFWWSILD